MTAGLKLQFAEFHRFNTVRFFGAQSDPVSVPTALKYSHHVRCLMSS